jgi:hypothetical protein
MNDGSGNYGESAFIFCGFYLSVALHVAGFDVADGTIPFSVIFMKKLYSISHRQVQNSGDVMHLLPTDGYRSILLQNGAFNVESWNVLHISNKYF